MLSKLKKLFGGKSIDEVVYADLREAVYEGKLDVKEVIEAHLQWKQRLLDQIENDALEHLDPAAICQDDQCKLGKWIYGVASARLGKYPGFSVLRINHQMFHHVAAKVVELHQVGRDDEAMHVLNTSFTFYSKKVITDLDSLAEVVAGD